jgi:nucleotide-binding universal stress UspA family protein
VGVEPKQPPKVAWEAAALAARLGVDLVFGYAQVNSYLIELDPPDKRDAESLTPVEVDEEMSDLAVRIADSIGRALEGVEASWSLRILSGDPAKALARLAEDISAEFIVVGTRRPGLGHHLEDVVSGSIAAHLSHIQPRPVLVIPLVAAADLPHG